MTTDQERMAEAIAEFSRAAFDLRAQLKVVRLDGREWCAANQHTVDRVRAFDAAAAALGLPVDEPAPVRPAPRSVPAVTELPPALAEAVAISKVDHTLVPITKAASEPRHRLWPGGGVILIAEHPDGNMEMSGSIAVGVRHLPGLKKVIEDFMHSHPRFDVVHTEELGRGGQS